MILRKVAISAFLTVLAGFAGVICFACGGVVKMTRNPRYLVVYAMTQGDERLGWLKVNRSYSGCNKSLADDAKLGRVWPQAINETFQMALVGAEPARTQPIFTALDLLWRAESSCGKQMVGDGGLACGHLQFHREPWEESCRRLGVDWPWPEDAYDLRKCAALAGERWVTYAEDALKRGDVEMLVRKHRLPNDPYRPSNNAYLERVMK